jgi:hypothetical protein
LENTAREPAQEPALDVDDLAVKETSSARN